MTFEDATLDSINKSTNEEGKLQHASFDAQMQENVAEKNSLSHMMLS